MKTAHRILAAIALLTVLSALFEQASPIASALAPVNAALETAP